MSFYTSYVPHIHRNLLKSNSVYTGRRCVRMHDMRVKCVCIDNSRRYGGRLVVMIVLGVIWYMLILYICDMSDQNE